VGQYKVERRAVKGITVSPKRIDDVPRALLPVGCHVGFGQLDTRIGAKGNYGDLIFIVEHLINDGQLRTTKRNCNGKYLNYDF
jgi:hypothetical protein